MGPWNPGAEPSGSTCGCTTTPIPSSPSWSRRCSRSTSSATGPGRHAGGPRPVPAPDGLVLVAWVDDEPAGCVAIRRAEVADPVGGPVAEMKRLYVRAAHRRNGLARALVRAAEDAAATAGYARLVLETGSRQPESIALYAAEGYEPVAAFGVYAGAPGARHLGKVLRRSPR
ncbi:GNAT family N-acetyltransferase [Pseudonocardia benzenivorans]